MEFETMADEIVNVPGTPLLAMCQYRLGAMDLLSGKMANHPILRREAIEAVGGHDVTLKAGIDLDLAA